MSFSHRPSSPRRPSYSHLSRHEYAQQGSLPDGCAYLLLPLVAVLAVLLFLALALHPQGYPLIPWLIDHL